MTSAQITEMASMFSAMGNQGQVPKVTTDNGDSFGDILGNISNASEASDSKELTYPESTKSEYAKKENVVSENASTNDTEKPANVQDDKPVSEVKTESVSKETETVSKEEMSDIEKDIMNQVAEDLDITVEELENILETLGLSAMDLLNQQNVSNLAATVLADGDMMAVVTDETVSEAVLNINADVAMTIEDAAAELGIDAEELKTQIEEAYAENESLTGEVPADFGKVPAKTDAELVNAEESIKVDSNVEDESLQTSQVEVYDATTNEATNKEDGTSFQQSGSNDSKEHAETKDNGNTIGREFAMNMNSDNTVNPVMVEETEMSYTSAVDQAEVVDQITEYMRAQVRDGVTELQMRLNPENLGTVNLTLASKEGNVTAQFTAQNDAVRAALESQIMQLKENLEQQGVKVTAVEVAVESHAFERNLEQGNDQNEARDEEEKRLKKATRKLNLNGIYADDIIEGLDEEEIVTAKMMQADGNSMDYKV